MEFERLVFDFHVGLFGGFGWLISPGFGVKIFQGKYHGRFPTG